MLQDLRIVKKLILFLYNQSKLLKLYYLQSHKIKIFTNTEQNMYDLST